MNNTLVPSIGRLAIGVSRQSVRYGHLLSPKARQAKDYEGTKFEPGHGEQIWVFNHILENMITYSHTRVVAANKAMKQIPFNGKKLKPAKIRKDYWQPLALIQFPEGQGDVGRSVYQKMREFRRLHELSYPDEVYHQSKRDRGVALNNQKANAVADIAAVLGGAGRGNKIWQDDKKLHEASVYWANDYDYNFASSWSDNVSHHLGFPTHEKQSGSTEGGLNEAGDGAIDGSASGTAEVNDTK